MRGRLTIILLAVWAVRAWSAVDDFEFVVIGDTRPRFESENFRIFESLIPKINAARPAFVINLGDLIYGYGPLSKAKQWDKYQQVIRAIQPPYYQVPGNHDTHSREARRIYGRRFGRFYGSFDHGDCHFVLLDNTEQERWGYLGPAQFDWLKADLQATKARSVFVFLHFPVWEPERVAPKYYDFWLQTLHPLFRASHVRAVFAGHFHSYGPSREFDGIRYFITGGGGAELIPDYRRSGGQYHFLRVKVSGESFDLRVATERGDLTDTEADVMGGLLFADSHCSRIGILGSAQALRAGGQCSISLTNPYAAFLSGKAEWTLDASTFALEPKTVSVAIPAGGWQTWDFTLRTLQDTVPLPSRPRLEFNVAAGGQRHRFHRDLLFLQEIIAPQRPDRPLLDGRLQDWASIPPLHLGRGARSEAEIRAAHDGETLYLAVTIPSLAAVTNEETAFPDDLQVGVAGRLSNTDFGRDVVRLGFSGTGSATGVRDRTPGRRSGTPVPGVRSVGRIDGDRASYEIAIPYRWLRPLKTSAGSHLVVNLSYPLPEAETDAPEPADPKLNSFFYQVRYGGGALVPVHFVEVVLEKKP